LVVVAKKARQAAKIAAIREALIEAGIRTLNEQSGALGLGRSSTHAMLQGRHKASGLSARLINRMLASPDLPPAVRAIVMEYVEEKLAGLYGHRALRLKQFSARLAIKPDHKTKSKS
jgi:hypothetical protein